MRIVLHLIPVQKTSGTLPFNYQYPISAWIYRTISEGDNEFARFLHEQGFGTAHKSYKFFTFSMLDLAHCHHHINHDHITINGGKISLEISFLAPETLNHFITGVFTNQKLTIADKRSRLELQVASVEMQPKKQFSDRVTFRTLSPILISERTEGHRSGRYCHPDDPGYNNLFLNNLTCKYSAAMQAGFINTDPNQTDQTKSIVPVLKITSLPKKKGITIKAGTSQETKIIGYIFEFTINAPHQLIEIGYHAGFGEKNSMGLGCVRTMDI